jgi:hypothetical protein
VVALGTLGAILVARRHHAVGSMPGARTLLTVAALCWVVFRVPALFTVMVVTVYLIARLVGRLRRTAHQRARANRVGPTTAVAIAIVGLAMGVAVNPTPWLPGERLNRDEGSPLVGYVLSDAGPSLLVMVHEGRAVVRLPADEVLSRELCRVRAGFLVQRLPDRWRTLAPPYGLLVTGGSPPGYPDFP